MKILTYIHPMKIQIIYYNHLFALIEMLHLHDDFLVQHDRYILMQHPI
jgi:hypothetical protein